MVFRHAEHAENGQISAIPTRKPTLIEVSPSTHHHHGIVNLESNEEDYESTVTSKPVIMFTTGKKIEKKSKNR